MIIRTLSCFMLGLACCFSQSAVCAERRAFPVEKRLVLDVEKKILGANTDRPEFSVDEDHNAVLRLWCNIEWGSKFNITAISKRMVEEALARTLAGCIEEVTKADDRLRAVFREARWWLIGRKLWISSGDDLIDFFDRVMLRGGDTPVSWTTLHRNLVWLDFERRRRCLR